MHLGIVKFAIIILCCVLNKVSSKNKSGRAIAVIPGDFTIGLFVSAHHPPKSKKADPSDFLKCGEIREHYGIQRTEIALKTIDEINANLTLLPNISLGIEIRDSCWYAPIALQQSIEMIKDTISPKNKHLDTCGADEEMKEYYPSNGQLIAVVGPGSSSVALQVQNLLQLFSIPQIGYSTTSKDLSDKARFSTFMRVVPSDYYQAQVIVDIVKHFNWTYVSIINTDENYGQSGIQAFRELAEKNGICIAKDSSILSNDDKEKFNIVLNNTMSDEHARVVVCFCEGMTIRGLLMGIKDNNLTNKLLLIGTDGWADRADVVEKYEKEALGSISIRIHSPRVESFDPYYWSLNPKNNSRNPWFKEFWMSKFNCTFPSDENLQSVDKELHAANKTYCTGTEKLSSNYTQEPKLSFIIKAIYTIAYGLQKLQEQKCGKNFTGKCDAMKTFNGTHFFDILKNVTFTYPLVGGDIVNFTNQGDPPGRYDIINYQQDGEVYKYVKIGEWRNNTLNLTDLLMNSTRDFQSSCSKPCSPGYYRQHNTVGQEQKCCWRCTACDENQYLLNDTYCENCSLDETPNENKTSCVPLPHYYVKWTDSEAIISICFASFGFICTFVVLIIFVQYNNTPVVKASTRELCYLILIGMMLCHISTLFFIAKPQKINCTITRILPGISFSMIYASLLVKTNRIARILAGSKKRFPTRKPKFMSAGAQLVITSIIIMVEAGISIIMVINEPANTKLIYPGTRDKVVVECNTSKSAILGPLSFIFILIAFCTLYALKTRNVPENFNEAKFIGFAMYTTCVIWIASFLIYFGSESKIITMCLCISVSAMVTLSFLFLPKLYIILLHPEKNIRALFTTSKSIRCHIGSRVASAILQKTPSSISSVQEYSLHDDFIGVERKDTPKPKIRSSSCQTSLELLNALLDLRKIPNGSHCDLPTLGWSELNINDLPTIGGQKKNLKYNMINSKPLITDLVLTTPKNCSISNKIYDASNPRLHQILTKSTRNDFNSIPSEINSNNRMMITRTPAVKKSNFGKSKLEAKKLTTTSKPLADDELKYFCQDCQEYEKSRKRSFCEPQVQEYNRNEEQIERSPIYTIDSVKSNLMKPSISEESLSECSISETCDCKLKSITIRLANPRYNV